MKAIKTTIDGSVYYLLYNAEAMFELEERIDARLKVSPAEKGSRAEFEIVE